MALGRGFSVPDDGGDAGCYDCDVGQHVGGDDVCVDCPAGTYVPSAGWGEDCLPCPAGSASWEGAVECIPCDPGTYASADGTECVPCDVATYQGSTGSASCLPVFPGYATILQRTAQQACTREAAQAKDRGAMWV